MKRRIKSLLTIFIITTIIAGCSTSEYSELEKLRQENELLKTQLSEVTDIEKQVLPSYVVDSTVNQSESDIEIQDKIATVQTDSFEKIIFEGSGDDVITDVNLPEGIFISTIKIDSEEYCSVRYHMDDESELLVNDSGPYYGVSLIKNYKYGEVSGGILEVQSKGAWSIEIDLLSGEATSNLVGSGDVVTGLFAGSGKKEIALIDMKSDSYHSVRMYEYTNLDNRIFSELLVNDSGVYNGKCLVDTKEDSLYFFVVESEGEWSIDLGRGDEVTEYNNSYVLPSAESDTVIEEDTSKTNSAVLAENSAYLSEVCHLINKFNGYYFEEKNHKIINEQGLADYIDEYENIYYPVAEWITLVIHPSTDNSTIEDAALRFDPVGRKGAWILDVMTTSKCLLQAAYPDIDSKDASAVTIYYEDTLYDGSWNWPSMNGKGRYTKNGINCDLYRAINSLIFKVVP